MTFVHPALLLLLWPVPALAALCWWRWRRREARAARLAGPAKARAVFGRGLAAAQIALGCAALALALVALARPQWGEREEEVLSQSRNVLVLLDVSRSMLAGDVRPSRLERAKADLSDLVDSLAGDRAALVAFRSAPVVLCPFTTDDSFLREAIADASIDSAPRGETDLGRALRAALELFAPLGADANAIVLVSDGEDLGGAGRKAAEECGARGIPVFCMGVGSAAGANVPAGEGGLPLVHRGEKVVSKLRSADLEAIAAASGGVYLPLESTSSGGHTLGSLYRDHVRALVAREKREALEARRVERYPLFLLPALLLLLAAAFLSRGRPAARRVRATAVLALALPAFAATAADAPPDRRALAREAQAAWRGGDPATAADRYRAALDAPGPADALETSIRRNAAIAALAAGRDSDAESLFASLPGADAAEGRAVALFRLAGAETPDPATNAAVRAAAWRRREADLVRAAGFFRDSLHGAEEPALSRRRAALRRALDDLAAARESAEAAEIEAKWGGRDAIDVLAAAMDEQRDAFADAKRAFTNALPARIPALEAAAAKQRAAAAAWGPLREALRPSIEAVTNETLRAKIEGDLAEASARAADAADALEALDPAAFDAMEKAEGVAFDFFATAAPPVPLLEQAVLAQSNALSRVVNPARIRTPAANQIVALMLFQAFDEKIAPWLDSLEEQAAALPGGQTPPPGAAPMDPEKKKELLRLCEETRGTHEMIRMGLGGAGDVLPDAVRPDAKTSFVNLKKILDLLRDKDDNRQQKQDQQQQQQHQQQQQDKQDQKQDKQDKQQSQQSQQSQQQQSQESKQDQAQPQEPEETQEAEAAKIEEEKDPDEEAARAIIKMILEQEKKRAAEKRKRARDLPPAIGVRDW
ncbi:MAG: VWA domain-containing protein [Kiritimatiellae bacterium]|nr:VWA domain-containing protein [Kiritimatiellia bacterium]